MADIYCQKRVTVDAPLFYSAPDARQGDVITLSKSESKHAQVLRLKAGDSVIVVDGLGLAFYGEILSLRGKHGTIIGVHSESRQFGEPTVRLTLASGLSSAHKFDTTIQKGTELGVSRFVPVLTERSKIRIEDDRKAIAKVRRLEKVALSAMKQCRRSFRPDISVPMDLLNYLSETDNTSLNLIFHPGSATESLNNVDIQADVQRINLLVGPESGFSHSEVIAAKEAGYRQIGLGKRILRTETAGPIVCALVMARFGELN